MRRDEVSRNRSVLLARWRDAAAVAREPGESGARFTPLPIDAAARVPAPTLAATEDGASSTNEATRFAPARDEETLIRQLEAEIRRAVPRTTADTLCAILAAPRARASELTPEIRAAILAKLDLVEDVLDAVLLAGRGHREAAESEREPP